MLLPVGTSVFLGSFFEVSWVLGVVVCSELILAVYGLSQLVCLSSHKCSRESVCTQILASSTGHSQFFNVTRRKTGEPGARVHVSDVVPGTNLEPT